MPPMTDNQRESAIRDRVRELRDRKGFCHMSHRDLRRIAAEYVDGRSHLRGKYAR